MQDTLTAVIAFVTCEEVWGWCKFVGGLFSGAGGLAALNWIRSCFWRGYKPELVRILGGVKDGTVEDRQFKLWVPTTGAVVGQTKEKVTKQALVLPGSDIAINLYPGSSEGTVYLGDDDQTDLYEEWERKKILLAAQARAKEIRAKIREDARHMMANNIPVKT